MLRDESGWVMVPVIALLAVAIGLGMALLLLVDNQTRASAQQRDMDAAQTLAEGVLTSTANVLAASDSTPDTWGHEGCQTLTGSLTDAADGGTFRDRVSAEVQRSFEDEGELSTYRQAGRSAGWTVYVCPTKDNHPTVGDTEARFAPAVLDRTVAKGWAGPTGWITDQNGNAHTTLWVQAQANIRSATDTPVRSRSVAAKVQQGGSDFVPSQDVVDTGSFSNDLAIAGGTLLQGDLLGGVTRQLLGAGDHPLIAGKNDTIGVRCGLLNALHPSLSNVLRLQLCLTGTLDGVASLLQGLNPLNVNLDGVNDLLGISGRFRSLDGWTVAPPQALDAYRAAAKQSGIYKAQVNGTENVQSNGDAEEENHPCLDASDQPDASKVIFIERVGNNGEQYCTLSGDHTARIFIVARGGVRVTGTFNGVIYAPNLQECGDDGVCTNAERQAATDKPREVVRIKPPGKVIGAVWVDGAGGQVRIVPGTLDVSSTSLVNLGGVDNAICALPGVTASLVNAVTGLVTNLLNSLPIGLGYQYKPDPNADVCASLGSALSSLPGISVLGLFGGGETSVSVPVLRRECLVLCTAWHSVIPPDKAKVVLPPLLGDTNVLNQIASLLGSSLNNYTAVQRDQDAIDRAGIELPGNAAFVPGTYRNVPVTSGT